MANQTLALLEALKDCLCTQLATDGNPVCECCLVVSDELPPMTGCDCVCESGQGKAWARFVSADFQQDELTKCPVGPWQVRFQLGVYRCVSSEPTCETGTLEAEMIAEDLATLQRAVACCPALGGRRWTFGNIQIIGPSGGCVGVAVEVVTEFGAL